MSGNPPSGRVGDHPLPLPLRIAYGLLVAILGITLAVGWFR